MTLQGNNYCFLPTFGWEIPKYGDGKQLAQGKQLVSSRD